MGFSLIEVAMALGIISFCLIPLLGMVPVGLASIKASREHAGAANCLELIAGSLRQATATAGGYQANGAFSNICWSSTGSAVVQMSNISIAGLPGTNAGDQRLAAYVEIIPPSTVGAATAARISVAWPQRANYDAAAARWSSAQGSISTWLVFLPAQ